MCNDSGFFDKFFALVDFELIMVTNNYPVNKFHAAVSKTYFCDATGY